MHPLVSGVQDHGAVKSEIRNNIKIRMAKMRNKSAVPPWFSCLVIGISVIVFCFVLRYSSFEISRLSHVG
jgi:hypothetical protein